MENKYFKDCKTQEDYEKASKIMEKDETPKDVERFYLEDQICSTVGASWECRDCIILNDEDYFKVKFGEK